MTVAERDVPLVGRDGEKALLHDAVRRVAAGGGGEVVALLGEAGIGKSALLADLREAADAAGLAVFEGRAAEHEQDVPFGVVIDALDDHVAGLHTRRLEALGDDRVADLAAVLPGVARDSGTELAQSGATERFRYHRALTALLDLLAREKPVALLIDDVHWADEATVEWLLGQLRRSFDAPLLLVLASRPVDPAPRLLDALRAGRRAHHLDLRPLDAAAARDVVGAVESPELRERLVAEAGGNPLYLRELARVAGDATGALPSTLVAAVQLEVGSLPPASRALLEGAAVAGDPFDPELAAAAADLSPDDSLVLLDKLAAADLVRPTGTARGFAFRHPIVRRAVYDSSPAGWRIGAHERVAAALDARGAGPVAVAHHVEQSAHPGDPAAVAVLEAAGHASMETSPAGAARWFKAALELLAADAAERRLELVAPMAHALAMAGRLNEARPAFDQALALMPPEPTRERLDLVVACALAEQTLGNWTEARRLLSVALTEIGPDGDPGARAVLELHIAASAAFFDEDVAAVAHHTTIATHLAEGREPALVAAAHALGALAAMWDARTDDARPLLDEASAAFAALSDDQLARWPDTSYWVGFAEILFELPERTLATTRRGMAVAHAFKRERSILPLAGLRGMCLGLMGRHDEAMEVLEAVEEECRLQGLDSQLAWMIWQRAGINAIRGDITDSDRAAREAEELFDKLERIEDNLVTRNGRQNLAGRLLFTDPERYLRTMIDLGVDRRQSADITWSTYLWGQMVLAELACGRPEKALERVELIEEHSRRHGLAGGSGRAKVGRAQVLIATGEPAEAARLAAEAAALFEERSMGSDLMAALLTRGAALAADGASDDAIAVLQRVVDLAERGGAVQLRDIAAQQLRALGVRIAPPARSGGPGGLEGLTEREREIAELVAEGRSNKAVAATLFLSEKTIEHHLSRIYAKLGVRSRVQLTAVLARS